MGKSSDTDFIAHGIRKIHFIVLLVVRLPKRKRKPKRKLGQEKQKSNSRREKITHDR